MTHNLGLYVHHTLNVKWCCGERGNVGNWETHPYDLASLFASFLLLTDNDNTGFDRIYYLKLAVRLFKQKERERETLDTEQRNGRTLVKADPSMSHILQNKKLKLLDSSAPTFPIHTHYMIPNWLLTITVINCTILNNLHLKQWKRFQLCCC